MSHKSLGFMYLAKRPCGRVSAMCWDEPKHEKSTSKLIVECLRRGDTVERVERFEGEKLPELICRPGCTDCIQKPEAAPLESTEARYRDLLGRLGVLGHAGAVAEIEQLRAGCGLSAGA